MTVRFQHSNWLQGEQSLAHAHGGCAWRLLFLLLCLPAFSAWGLTQTADLDTLVAHKEYPALEQALAGASLNAAERAYYGGLLDNHLNRPQSSVDLLESILPSLEIHNPLRAELAVCTLADDFVKLSQYGKASDTYTLAARIAESESRESFCHADREAARWALFSDASPQSVTLSKPVVLHGTRDALGLLQLPVNAGNYHGAWLLDTGANLTVIRRSVADRIGVQLSTSASTAQGSSGMSVAVRAGIVPELHLGTAIVRNVPVLVVDDADLTFDKVDYQIDGSLGLPVLAALDRVTIAADGTVTLGSIGRAAPHRTTHNLFFERETPLIAADLGYGQNLFVMDTGAQGTILSAQFFAATKGTSQLGKLVTLDLAGAGGVGTMAAFGSENLTANFNGFCTPLGDAHILTSPTGSEDDFSGVIGQSAFHRLSSITLDFRNMQFTVSGDAGSCTAPAAATGR